VSPDDSGRQRTPTDGFLAPAEPAAEPHVLLCWAGTSCRQDGLSVAILEARGWRREHGPSPWGSYLMRLDVPPGEHEEAPAR
jgi:hypothetical protein